ncbi:AAA family ATPase [Sediminispirochaeta bajacaliforniensis]|uniref:AAA family ATPase n=1 Tax=Sediminispirochaeta bajacaliforniensis TaxID=148 RepID=UPI00037DA0EF|nr:AAA family ATPase [Sediminispirochaeta bajacaliforniensis]
MAPKIIYITGFRQHAGKTVTSLGLIHLLKRCYPPEKIGYIKPVGQELVELSSGLTVDKDVKIVTAFTGIDDTETEFASPVQLRSGFTKAYIANPDREMVTMELREDIMKAMAHFASMDVIVAEGTGHPGVGGIIGLSNAEVGKLLGADVVFLSGGGIGKALDMLEVDLSYFMHKGCNVRGIIFNKILPDKIDQSRRYLTEELLRRAYPGFPEPLRILGFLPVMSDLPNPSMDLIRRKFKDAEVVGNFEEKSWHRPCRSVRIISLRTEYLDLARYIGSGDLIIIGSGSTERLRKVLEHNAKLTDPVGGIIITCKDDATLDPEIHRMLEEADIPTLLIDLDTAGTEQQVMQVFENTKLQLYDNDKYQKICSLFEEYFDFEKFRELFLP